MSSKNKSPQSPAAKRRHAATELLAQRNARFASARTDRAPRSMPRRTLPPR